MQLLFFMPGPQLQLGTPKGTWIYFDWLLLAFTSRARRPALQIPLPIFPHADDLNRNDWRPKALRSLRSLPSLRSLKMPRVGTNFEEKLRRAEKARSGKGAQIGDS